MLTHIFYPALIKLIAVNSNDTMSFGSLNADDAITKAVTADIYDVLIIGGGLTGLTLAHTILNVAQKQGKRFPSVLILEARDRLGGRISTIETPVNKNPVEVGATWVFSNFNAVQILCRSLGVELMPQYSQGKTAYLESSNGVDWVDDSNDSGQYRIKGGTSALLTALQNGLTREGNFSLKLNSPVVSIVRKKNEVMSEVSVEGGAVFKARKVVTTLPPQLLVHTVKFTPALPEDFAAVARETGTWMGDSMKGIVTYRTPFWRANGQSGALYSNEGPFIQMLDQTSSDEKKFALVGFLDAKAFSNPDGSMPTMNSVDAQLRGSDEAYDQRKSKVTAQLVKVFGKEAAEPLEYLDCYWKQERYTMTPAELKNQNENAWGVTPTRRFVGRQHNFGHSVYRRNDLHDGALIVGGTETAPRGAGFMEGAVVSALTIAKLLGFV